MAMPVKKAIEITCEMANPDNFKSALAQRNSRLPLCRLLNNYKGYHRNRNYWLHDRGPRLGPGKMQTVFLAGRSS